MVRQPCPQRSNAPPNSRLNEKQEMTVAYLVSSQNLLFFLHMRHVTGNIPVRKDSWCADGWTLDSCIFWPAYFRLFSWNDLNGAVLIVLCGKIFFSLSWLNCFGPEIGHLPVQWGSSPCMMLHKPPWPTWYHTTTSPNCSEQISVQGLLTTVAWQILGAELVVSRLIVQNCMCSVTDYPLQNRLVVANACRLWSGAD